MSNFIKWIPITSPTPVKTFPKRLIIKWRNILTKILSPVQRISRTLFYSAKILASSIAIRIRSRFRGARIVGVSQNGNTILRLNKNYALGRKGTDLELPQDLVIFESVKSRGDWELEESEFLAIALRKVGKIPNSKAALLDIGANTGLVTLQAMNQKQVSKYSCLNPSPDMYQPSSII